MSVSHSDFCSQMKILTYVTVTDVSLPVCCKRDQNKHILWQKQAVLCLRIVEQNDRKCSYVRWVSRCVVRAVPACRARPGSSEFVRGRASGRGWWRAGRAPPLAGSARTPAAGRSVCPGERGRRTLRPDGAARGGAAPTPPCRRLWGKDMKMTLWWW